jgi:hypothetical protein
MLCFDDTVGALVTVANVVCKDVDESTGFTMVVGSTGAIFVTLVFFTDEVLTMTEELLEEIEETTEEIEELLILIGVEVVPGPALALLDEEII